MLANESEANAESEGYDSASVLPIYTRSELSFDSDFAYHSASVASVAEPALNIICFTRISALKFAKSQVHFKNKP